MRTVTAVAFISAMVLIQASAETANTTTVDELQHGELSTGSMAQKVQSQMFDGIQLTENQRRQLRDLMQQARHECFSTSVDDVKNMHNLVTADTFNEAAIRAQVEKIAQIQIRQTIAIARVRNQMYHLLTPAQQAILHKNFEQRLNKMHQLASLQPVSLQVVRSDRNQ